MSDSCPTCLQSRSAAYNRDKAERELAAARAKQYLRERLAAAEEQRRDAVRKCEEICLNAYKQFPKGAERPSPSEIAGMIRAAFPDVFEEKEKR